ncbi:MAG: AAA family ATPase, partial [Gaiellaceae bacterium]
MPTTHAIVGREPELQQLREVVESAARPVVAFVEGEAGVGRTALLETIVSEASAAGMLVLRARPTAAEARSSFAALDDLLRPAIEGLPRLAEPQRRALAAALLLEAAIEPVDPRLVGLAALALLEGLPGPVLLAVDDWQWLDAASAAVLSFVLRRLEPGDANVIATVRAGEADEAVAGLVRALPPDQAIELTVGPLDPGALGRLVHARTGTWLPPPALARLHAACEGNPLLAMELVRAPGAEAATDIRRLLATRVGALAPGTRAALRYVAALAEPTLDAVEVAVGSSDGLEEALAADVIVRDGARLRFSHPLIGAVVQERTPPGEWRAIHARLAELTDEPEQRARHLAAASAGPDEDVAAALEAAAGEAAVRGATMAAAELAQRAAELTPDADRRLPRLIAAADAAMVVGDGQSARGSLDEVVARAEAGPLRAGALRRLAYLVTDDSALRVAESALEEAGDDDELRAEVHLKACTFATMGGDGPRALRHAEAGARHAEAAGSPVMLAEALCSIAFIRHLAGEGVQREPLLRAAALERAGADRFDETALETLGMQLYNEGKLAESRRLLTEELERAQARGRLDHESMALMLLAELEVRAGRWQVADGYASETLDLTLGSESWNAEAAGHWTRALVDAHLGREETAREHAETGRRQAAALGDLAFATRCAHVLGFVALSLGDAAGAVRHLGPLRDSEERLGLREPAAFCIAPDLAEALVLAGNLEA